MSDRRERIDRAREHARALRGGRVEIVVAPTLFPTPQGIARYMMDLAEIDPGMTVLEPSAGTGALLDELPEECEVLAIEIVRELAERLSVKYPSATVLCADFLEFDGGARFDRIVMNPPFDHGFDINHILHARELLAPGGRLIAICADGPRQRAALGGIAESYECLPEGTFAAQGTGVRTAIVVIEGAGKENAE